MSATNLSRIAILVPIVVAVQTLAVHGLASAERPPWPPDLNRLPAVAGAWNLLRNDPIDPAIAKELGADRILSRSYVEIPGGRSAMLLVAWFQSQRGGARQPHSPKVCLPGEGWTPRVVDELAIDTSAGTIQVNRYIVSKAAERAVVLYWYQTPRRVIAGEWAAKFWLATDALRDKRTDTALVRVIVWPASEGDDVATTVATGFARDLYPMLRQSIPRLPLE
jgi:EpsI family protein